jgi:hypothetical protein
VLIGSTVTKLAFICFLLLSPIASNFNTKNLAFSTQMETVYEIGNERVKGLYGDIVTNTVHIIK